MSHLELDQLLSPLDDAAPAGPNLEYEPEFLELERLAAGTAEQQIGEVITPAEEPDYNLVLKQALALMKRSRDLRIITLAVRALVRVAGFDGLQEGLALLRGTLEQSWDTVHPELEEEDDNDPTMRISALAALVSAPFVADLKVTPIIQSSSFGAISVRELNSVSGDEPHPDVTLDAAALEGAFRQVGAQVIDAALSTLNGSIAQIDAIEALLDGHDARGLDWKSPKRILVRARDAAAKRQAVDSGETAEENQENDGDGSGGAPMQRTGRVQSRLDVLASLEQICTYYAKYEPSSPVPLLLERCKRLVDMSFLEVMQDMAPNGVPQIEVLAGKSDKD